MPFIKEKSFYVGSVIENLTPSGLVDGEPEKTETRPQGFFKVSEDEFNISYREETEGGPVFCDITVRADGVTVKRRGAVESDMFFSEGQTHKSLYSVPPYAFDAEIFTKKIRNTLGAGGGRLDIFYRMRIGGADKNVRMKIEV